MFRVIKVYEVLPVVETTHTYGSLVIPAEGVCLYASGKVLKDNRQPLYAGLQAGELHATDIFGNAMPYADLLSDILYISDEAEAYDMSSPIYQVNWNMRIYPQLVAIVRGEMLAESLTAMGLSATAMLQKLSSVVAAIQVGMFKEAWQMLQYQMVRDAFLTEERIGKYVKLLQAADVIDYTIPQQG